MSEAAARRARLPELARFEICDEIGHGGMATVYRAVDRRLGREVALKVIHPHLRDSVEVASRFHAEARAVAKLRHRNIVEVYDVSGPEDPEQFLVVELVRGTTLRRLLRDRGAIPAEIAAAIGLQLLEAIAHAHASGVVHRDIKPENVLVECGGAGAAPAEGASANREAEHAKVKLTDFGIAKLLDAQGVTSTGQVLGSPAHMAPEQIEGGEVDGRADLFGLGVLLYECVVGHLPFEGANPAQVLRRVLEGQYAPAVAEAPTVGARWSTILDKALARARADRFAEAVAMHEALAAELRRLAFWPPEPELDAWLTDAEGYARAYRPRLVERLRTLADGARRRGAALDAAGDYNRALANAPDDPRLLRVVARMQRTERRARALRRAAIAVGSVAATAVVAAGGYRLTVAGVRPPSHGAAGASSAGVAASAAASASTAAVVGPVDARLPSTPDAHAPPPMRSPVRATDRTLTLDLTPPLGVSVAVDRLPPRQVSTGDTLTLDGRAHTLVFSCPVCTPVPVAVAPGDRDDTFVVVVPVKPAVLVIEGEVDKTYQIPEHPELAVRAGANTVALKSAFEHVTVEEIETGVRVGVRLEAGKSVRARF